MHYDRSIASVIEAAVDSNPYCGVCGAVNSIRADDEGFLLECGAAAMPRGLLARVLYALLPHERIRVLP